MAFKKPMDLSFLSRPEALQHREACLKYTVKKADRHQVLDVLREASTEEESYHSMLEASLIAHRRHQNIKSLSWFYMYLYMCIY